MSTIEEIIKTYNPETINDNKAILREIVQSIVLVGLSRTDFLVDQFSPFTVNLIYFIQLFSFFTARVSFSFIFTLKIQT